MSEYRSEEAFPDRPAGRESMSERAAEQVGDAASTAREQVRSAAGQARSRLADQVDRRSTDAGKRIGASAADVRSVADTLRDQGRGGAADLAEQVARRGERFGRYLEDADSDRLIRDVENFARRRPWAVAAGALAAGFAAARFLKASSGRRYHATSSTVRPSTATAGWADDRGYDRGYEQSSSDIASDWAGTEPARSRAAYDYEEEPLASTTTTVSSDAPPVTTPADRVTVGETPRPTDAWPTRDPADPGDDPGVGDEPTRRR